VRVLVTGGAGYIGSHGARALARRGHHVLIYDNLSTGHLALRRPCLMWVNRCRIHGNTLRTMCSPGLAFLNVVENAGVRRIVFSSTCAVYGVPAKIQITEDPIRQPVNPYGASKLFFENALEAYSKAYGLGYVSLRYFNPAGADESDEIGEMHEPERHLIPCALQAAAGIRPNLEVYGTDYPTRDGTCVPCI
jgi:UDP-glucose 4-epimerase